VNTSVKRSEGREAERKDPAGGASLDMQDGSKAAMKSNKGDMHVYDFYSLAKVFQDPAKRQES
jgi:hypothetical protein